MTKTVLIVTSCYAPAMTADMQRARLLAWELLAFGWDVQVLAPDMNYQHPSVLEPDSEIFFHAGTPVHYVPPLGPALWNLIRSSTIGWRALWPLNMAAKILFSRRCIDLVYISTTQFNLFLLGWWWRIRYGWPYVLDIQDPIYREYPGYYGGTGPGLKRIVNLWLHKHIEALTTGHASGLVSVSFKYIETFRGRYSHLRPEWLQQGRHVVIPFAADERSLLEVKAKLGSRAPRRDALRRIVYVGVGGPVMRKSFATFCHAIRMLAGRQEIPNIPFRIELYGTMFGWREGDRNDLLEIARESGVGNLVSEYPGRVTYHRSLELLLEADGALVLGVDDEGYMPSKLYTYALSGKPLLGIFRRSSAAHNAFIDEPRLGHLLSFGSNGVSDDVGIESVKLFLDEVAAHASFDRRTVVTNHLSVAMAAQHARLFNACIVKQSGTTASN
jgi:glycosyltransferase involved in cell wall biosynthesis